MNANAPLSLRTMAKDWTAKRLQKVILKQKETPMTQPNATPTLSTWQNSDPRIAVGHESSPKNDISVELRSQQGFCVARGSDILPEHFKAAGFTMHDFKFYPSSLLEVKARLPQFVILDLSTPTERIYSFDRCPF
jgi:hypothetical protein